MTLETLIKQRIREFGPLSVADYMALCLSHFEHGYYMRRDPFGATGDFTTSPEISQIFGELLGLWIAAQWQKQGSPEAILMELGPGRGTLMNDALRASKKVAKFHDKISVHLVEISPTLKQKQWAVLAGKHPNIQWYENLDALPPLPLFFIANEFFDALPVRQHIGAQERMIALDESMQLTFSPPILPSSLKGEGLIVESSPASMQVMKKLAAHIAQHGGGGLVIDYGYTGGSLGDTLQALKNHAFHDVLATPGEADITAHVDFDALKIAAEQMGASVFGAMPQGKFLLQIGASQRLMSLCQTAREEQRAAIMSGFERLISHEQMGELFKVLAVLPAGVDRAEGT